MKCQFCNTENEDGVLFCNGCGRRFPAGNSTNTTNTGSYQGNTAAPAGNAQGSTVEQVNTGTSSLTMVAFITSIISDLCIICGCNSLLIAMFGLPLGIAALIMSIISNHKQKSSIGIAALICSIISTILGIGAFLIFIVLVIEEM